MKTPFLVSIMQTVAAFSGQTYEIEVFGLGYETPEAAALAIPALVARWNATSYRCGPGEFTRREHRAVLKTGCQRCGVRGVEPGFKKKKCGACGGIGTLEGHVQPISVLGALVSEVEVGS